MLFISKLQIKFLHFKFFTRRKQKVDKILDDYLRELVKLRFDLKDCTAKEFYLWNCFSGYSSNIMKKMF